MVCSGCQAKCSSRHPRHARLRFDAVGSEEPQQGKLSAPSLCFGKRFMRAACGQVADLFQIAKGQQLFPPQRLSDSATRATRATRATLAACGFAAEQCRPPIPAMSSAHAGRLMSMSGISVCPAWKVRLEARAQVWRAKSPESQSGRWEG